MIIVKINTNVDVELEDLFYDLDYEQAFAIIKQVEEGMQDWEFTQLAAVFFIKAIKGLAESHPQYNKYLDELKEMLK